MIIKKLPFLRTHHKQVPTNSVKLDKAIGTYYNSAMQEIDGEDNYIVVNTEESHAEIGLHLKERVVLRFNTAEEAEQITNMETGSFTYHNFTCKRPVIDQKYIYNYEFRDYENLSRTANEMNLPSGLLWDYLKYFGSDYILNEDIKTIGNAIVMPLFGPVTSYPLEVSYRLGDEDNEIFDKRSQFMGGSEPKNYGNNYFREYVHRNENEAISYNPDWQKKQQNIFIMYNEYKNIDYLPNCVTFKIDYTEDKDNQHTIVKTLNNNELSKYLFLYIKRTDPLMVPFFNSYDKEINLKAWDLLDWLKNEDFSSIEGLADEIILYDRNDVDLFGIRRYLPRRFRKILALGQINHYIKHNLLRFEDVIENKKSCMSSVLGYKVEKSLTEDGEAIQTFYLEGHRNNFIDSQICYDKRYFYRVSELRVVVGGEYDYNTQDSPLLRRAIVILNIKPSIKVIEKHVYTFAYKVSTPPIYSPHVIVSNEELIRNKVKFFISDFIGNSVEHIAKIEKVLETDEVFFENLKLADFIDSNEEARFFSRSNTGNFEVYRIETKPESYQDFAPGFIGVFNNHGDFKLDQEKHAAFIDFIEHEKTYYYMFRSLDHHGNPGKPSFVSEVYLIDDADEVHMRYKSYDIYEKREAYDNTKSFRKYLQIVPAYKHVLYKPLDSTSIDLVDMTSPEQPVNCLGVQDGASLWDYNNENYYIKLRMTSKKTGKKFDLNLRFKQIKN